MERLDLIPSDPGLHTMRFGGDWTLQLSAENMTRRLGNVLFLDLKLRRHFLAL